MAQEEFTLGNRAAYGGESIERTDLEIDTVTNIRALSLQNDEESEPSLMKTKASLLRTWTRGMDCGIHILWPKWSTLGGSSNSASPLMNLALKIQPGITDYTKAFAGETAAVELFEDAASHVLSIKEILNKSASLDKLEEALVEQMVLVVFGSNVIECVGLGFDETAQLCRAVFAGDEFSKISPRSTQYPEKLEQIVQDSAHSLPHTNVRDRREVVNHAGAFMYMADRVLTNDELFSEELIRSTHKILVRGIDAVHFHGPETPSQQYAGVYRHNHVSAGDNNFVTPAFVPKAMKRFIRELNEKLKAAEEKREIDPFYIAADAAGEFVNVHPFLDGNGRTCRLILNTILLKYAGSVAPIGEKDGERREYLDIAKRRGSEECGNGELALYLLCKALQTLERLRERLRERLPENS
ncbi:hypothetical protein ABW19_dt0205859 [Dactylella cylindrospora]|nr:hypothetical protein ABW19_dt0205859 [Dactylella cylindrospora]